MDWPTDLRKNVSPINPPFKESADGPCLLPCSFTMCFTPYVANNGLGDFLMEGGCQVQFWENWTGDYKDRRGRKGVPLII